MSETRSQVLRFCLIGMLNGAITYISLFVFNRILGLSLHMSNFIGYLLVLAHSFIWSKLWIFKSHGSNIMREFAIFTITFLVAYTMQFVTFYSLTKAIGVNEYWANLVSLIVFGASNFLINRNYTFRHNS